MGGHSFIDIITSARDDGDAFAKWYRMNQGDETEEYEGYGVKENHTFLGEITTADVSDLTNRSMICKFCHAVMDKMMEDVDLKWGPACVMRLESTDSYVVFGIMSM
jgi:hypothetical protein